MTAESVTATNPSFDDLVTEEILDLAFDWLLIGALFLSSMDEEMERSGLFYTRFMDDWVVLAKTRWQLRKAIRKVNAIFEKLQLHQHPDKTFIGYIRAGFDFLGYHFSRKQLRVAQNTFEQFQGKVDRLYERTASPLKRDEAVVNYVRRWLRWVKSGVCQFMPSGSFGGEGERTRKRQALRPPLPLMMVQEQQNCR